MLRARTLALLVTVALGSQPALADDCKQTEKAFLTAMRAVDKGGQLGVDLAVQCMFRGPDAKAVSKLDAAGRSVFAAFTKLRDPAPACIKAGDYLGTVETLGNAAGQRMGLAWAICSPKAQAKIAEMRRRGATEDAIKAELRRMGGEWMSTLEK